MPRVPMSRIPRLVRLASSVASALLLLIPSSARSVSVQMCFGSESVPFTKGSSVLSSSAKVLLTSHVARINELQLSGIVILATGDDDVSNEGAKEQAALAVARSASIRKFFVASGIAEQKIFVSGQKGSLDPLPRLGTAQVEYSGACQTRQ